MGAKDWIAALGERILDFLDEVGEALGPRPEPVPVPVRIPDPRDPRQHSPGRRS